MEHDDADALAVLLAARIAAAAPALAAAFSERGARSVACAWLDDLLPPALFAAIGRTLPSRARMVRRASLGEHKYVLAEPALMAPPLAALVGALADARVAAALADALSLPGIAPDPELYNGGLTIMAPGDFMRPHLDNSHDRAGRRRRRLVALFYLAPEWQAAWDGTLQVWGGPRARDPLAIGYRPNRLVLMAADDASWHSVGRVGGAADRTNLTAYYYDAAPDGGRVRLTRFAGWPGERGAGAALALQFRARSLAARLGLRRLVRNRHRRTDAR